MRTTLVRRVGCRARFRGKRSGGRRRDSAARWLAPLPLYSGRDSGVRARYPAGHICGRGACRGRRLVAESIGLPAPLLYSGRYPGDPQTLPTRSRSVVETGRRCPSQGQHIDAAGSGAL